jgi:hypothetical protein
MREARNSHIDVSRFITVSTKCACSYHRVVTPLRPVKRDIINRITKATNIHLKNVAAIPASVPNPKIAATSAIIAKITAHDSMSIPSLLIACNSINNIPMQ